MRITIENLRKFTRDFVNQRVANDHSVLAVYLTGSLAANEPLWCQVVDIDLVFVHHTSPEQAHEVLPLLPDVHFDIEHHDQKRYESTRSVRADALLAPVVYAAQPLYDGGHFFDFVQAGVRSQYDRPEYVYRRAAPLLQQARRTWMALQGASFSVEFFDTYLQIIADSAQALATLADVLLTSRRFVLRYGRALVSLQQEAHFQEFLSLLGDGQDVSLREFLPAWEAAWRPDDEARPPVDTLRRAYFRSGIETLLEGDMPLAALWPLLRTWTSALQHNEDAALAPWEELMQHLMLNDVQGRLQALDAMLDTAEQLLETWGESNGLL